MPGMYEFDAKNVLIHNQIIHARLNFIQFFLPVPPSAGAVCRNRVGR